MIIYCKAQESIKKYSNVRIRGDFVQKAVDATDADGVALESANPGGELRVFATVRNAFYRLHEKVDRINTNPSYFPSNYSVSNSTSLDEHLAGIDAAIGELRSMLNDKKNVGKASRASLIKTSIEPNGATIDLRDANNCYVRWGK